jgi:hypothetical protein
VWNKSRRTACCNGLFAGKKRARLSCRSFLTRHIQADRLYRLGGADVRPRGIAQEAKVRIGNRQMLRDHCFLAVKSPSESDGFTSIDPLIDEAVSIVPV